MSDEHFDVMRAVAADLTTDSAGLKARNAELRRSNAALRDVVIGMEEENERLRKALEAIRDNSYIFADEVAAKYLEESDE